MTCLRVIFYSPLVFHWLMVLWLMHLPSEVSPFARFPSVLSVVPRPCDASTALFASDIDEAGPSSIKSITKPFHPIGNDSFSRNGKRKSPMESMQISEIATLLKPEEAASLLKIFNQEFGDLRIKISFVVPNTSVWPPWSHGFELGMYVRKIRLSQISSMKILKYYPVLYEALTEAGFIWNQLSYIRDKNLDAFVRYQQLYGHLDVPIDFVIPKGSSEWEKRFWGIKLGSIAGHVKTSSRSAEQKYASLRVKLLGMGFSTEYRHRRPSFDIIEQALLAFKHHHGHCNVPSNFMIPPNDTSYPEDIRSLGAVVNDIRHKGYYSEYRDKLLAMGFVFEPKETRFDAIFKALKTYKRLHPDSTRIPQTYVVPQNATDFPKSARGLKLGGIFHNMMHLGHHKRHHEKIRQLGYTL